MRFFSPFRYIYVGDEKTPGPSLWNSLENPQHFSLYNLTQLQLSDICDSELGLEATTSR